MLSENSFSERGFGAQAWNDWFELSAELLDGDDFTFGDGGDAVTHADQGSILLGVHACCERPRSAKEAKRKERERLSVIVRVADE